MVAAPINRGKFNRLASFNPCKGFGVVAAIDPILHHIRRKSFNPCKGFGVVAAKEAGDRIDSGVVSIPVRVLGWLQLFFLPDRDILKGFNPCKGFGVVAALVVVALQALRLRFNPCKGFGVVAASLSHL